VGAINEVKGGVDTNTSNISNLTSNKQDKTDSGLNTPSKNVVDAINTAYALAGSAGSVAKVFDDNTALETALNGATSDTYVVGQQFLIKTTDVPDWWVSGILEEEGTDTLPTEGDYALTYNIGWYQISQLENKTVNLADYQTKTDSSLNTTDKSVVGAINETFALANSGGGGGTNVASATYASTNPALSGLTIGETTYKLLPQGTEDTSKFSDLSIASFDNSGNIVVGSEVELTLSNGNETLSSKPISYGLLNIVVGSGASAGISDAPNAYSIAMGYKSAVLGDHAIALGANTSATDHGAVAVGWQASAGSYAIALGDVASATGFDSIAVGYNASAPGYYSIVIGEQASAKGDHSSAIGWQASATGASSLAVGHYAFAKGNFSTAMGYYSCNYIPYSTTFDGGTAERQKVLHMFSPSKLFFRNEIVDYKKTTLAEYTNGKTLQDLLDAKADKPAHTLTLDLSTTTDSGGPSIIDFTSSDATSLRNFLATYFTNGGQSMHASFYAAVNDVHVECTINSVSKKTVSSTINYALYVELMQSGDSAPSRLYVYSNSDTSAHIRELEGNGSAGYLQSYTLTLTY
jgi:hypothetical protein